MCQVPGTGQGTRQTKKKKFCAHVTELPGVRGEKLQTNK